MPDDPGAAAALANRRAVKRLERTRLLRWAADTLGTLGIEADPPPVESEVSRTMACGAAARRGPECRPPRH